MKLVSLSLKVNSLEPLSMTVMPSALNSDPVDHQLPGVRYKSPSKSSPPEVYSVALNV
jgi:hypothetical protein